jgi:hypothetical protein
MPGRYLVLQTRGLHPNTSLTILDVTPRAQENGEAVPIGDALRDIDIVQLTGTPPPHLLEEATSSAREDHFYRIE